MSALRVFLFLSQVRTLQFGFLLVCNVATLVQTLAAAGPVCLDPGMCLQELAVAIVARS